MLLKWALHSSSYRRHPTDAELPPFPVMTAPSLTAPSLLAPSLLAVVILGNAAENGGVSNASAGGGGGCVFRRSTATESSHLPPLPSRETIDER